MTFDEELAKYLKQYAPLYGIKVISPIIAQAIKESAWGNSELALKAHNYFGIKYKVGRCPTALPNPYIKVGSEQNPDGSYSTSSMKWFAFDNLEQCVIGYLDFISIDRYKNLKGVTDAYEYCALLQQDGYATSLTYAESLYKDYILRYALDKYDREEGKTMFDFKRCILTKNDCYKKGQKMIPKGIIVHSTGANNPNLKRYVQPDDGLLGVNANNNSWNRAGLDTCVHAFIGKDKNGEVRCYQTLPFDMCAWGVGRGKNGSYNYSPAYIQFEICEDGLNDKNYFDKVMECATSFCAYLVETYNISIDNVISHHESYLRGYGSNHADCDHWLKRFGLDMDWFRTQVKYKLFVREDVVEESTFVYKVVKGDKLAVIATRYNTTLSQILMDNPSITNPNVIKVGQKITIRTVQNKKVEVVLNVGDAIALREGATYYNGKPIPAWVLKSKLYYRGENKNGAVFSILKIGAITGTVNKSDIIKL